MSVKHFPFSNIWQFLISSRRKRPFKSPSSSIPYLPAYCVFISYGMCYFKTYSSYGYFIMIVVWSYKKTCHNAGFCYWRNPMVDTGKFVLYLKSLSKMFNHTRWVPVTSTDRTKSIRNLCVIVHFGGVFVLSVSFLRVYCFFSFCLVAFVIGLSQTSSFLIWYILEHCHIQCPLSSIRWMTNLRSLTWTYDSSSQNDRPDLA